MRLVYIEVSSHHWVNMSLFGCEPGLQEARTQSVAEFLSHMCTIRDHLVW
jgi:hypothetical protein